MQEAKEKHDEEKKKKEEKVPVSAHTHIYDLISSWFHWGSFLCSFFLLSCQLRQSALYFKSSRMR